MSDVEPTEPRRAKITLNKDGVVGPVHRVVQEVLGVVPFCLNAVRNGDLSKPPELEGSFFQMQSRGLALTPEQRMQQYNRWLLLKGFQDLARGVRAMLEEAFVYISIMRRSQAPGGIHGQLGQVRVQLEVFKRRAQALNFPDLMEAVNGGLSSPLHFEKQFLSLQRVRNCLEHRNGIVRDKDADTGTNELRLSLPRLKLFYTDGGQEIEIKEPTTVVKDTLIGFKSEIRERAFKVGERVTFDVEEFSQIAFGCWAFANDLGPKLPDVPVAKKGPGDVGRSA
jgi:hypothetical protein